MLIEADMAGVIKLKWDNMHDEDINPKLYTLNPRFQIPVMRSQTIKHIRISRRKSLHGGAA